MKKLSIHPNTNGGRAIQTSKQLLENKNKFLCITILKGLGMEVEMTSNITFSTEFETVGGLRSPLITVEVEG